MRVPNHRRDVITAACVVALDAATAQVEAMEADSPVLSPSGVAMNAGALLIQSIGAEVLNRADFNAAIEAIAGGFGFLLTIIPPEQRPAAVALFGRSMALSGDLKEREDAARRAAN